MARPRLVGDEAQGSGASTSLRRARCSLLGKIVGQGRRQQPFEGGGEIGADGLVIVEVEPLEHRLVEFTPSLVRRLS